MLNIPLVFWMIAYPIVGKYVMDYVGGYICSLEKEVAEINPKYCDKLWIKVSVTDTKLNRYLVDMAFIAIWPIISIASVFKAEWWYDSIMHRNVYRKG